MNNLYSFIGIGKELTNTPHFNNGSSIHHHQLFAPTMDIAWDQARHLMPEHFIMMHSLEGMEVVKGIGLAEVPSPIAPEEPTVAPEHVCPPQMTFDTSLNNMALYLKDKGFVVYRKK